MDPLILDAEGKPFLLVTTKGVQNWIRNHVSYFVVYQQLSVSQEGETRYRAIFSPTGGMRFVLVNDDPFDGVEVTVFTGYADLQEFHGRYGGGMMLCVAT